MAGKIFSILFYSIPNQIYMASFNSMRFCTSIILILFYLRESSDHSPPLHTIAPQRLRIYYAGVAVTN